MCLITKSEEKIAEHDIECWKLFEIIETEDGERTITPYQLEVVDADVISGIKPFVSENYSNKEKIKRYGTWRIEDGYIHTYSTRNTLTRFIENMSYLISIIGNNEGYVRIHGKKYLQSNTIIKGYSLYKCIIPAGEKYFEGKYGVLSYASKSIRIINKITEFRHNYKRLYPTEQVKEFKKALEEYYVSTC